MPEPEKIVWVGGYPRVVNVPEEPKEQPLDQQILSDEEWEAAQKAAGITGWAVTYNFIKRVLGGE